MADVRSQPPNPHSMKETLIQWVGAHGGWCVWVLPLLFSSLPESSHTARYHLKTHRPGHHWHWRNLSNSLLNEGERTGRGSVQLRCLPSKGWWQVRRKEFLLRASTVTLIAAYPGGVFCTGLLVWVTLETKVQPPEVRTYTWSIPMEPQHRNHECVREEGKLSCGWLTWYWLPREWRNGDANHEQWHAI